MEWTSAKDGCTSYSFVLYFLRRLEFLNLECFLSTTLSNADMFHPKKDVCDTFNSDTDYLAKHIDPVQRLMDKYFYIYHLELKNTMELQVNEVSYFLI